MDDLALYSTITYSPGWYYKKWPGFYNMECYKVLAHYSEHPEAYQGVEESKEHEMSVEEEQTQEQNKKCKRKHEEST